MHKIPYFHLFSWSGHFVETHNFCRVSIKLTGYNRKLNVHKTFRKCLECLLNILCTFKLRPVSWEKLLTILAKSSS